MMFYQGSIMKKTIRNALGFSTLVIGAAFSGTASAQYYGGLNFTASRYAPDVVGEADAAGFFLTNTALDDRRIRYGLRLGYQFSPTLALVSRYSAFDQRDSLSRVSRSYGLDLESRAPLLAGFAFSGSAGISRLRAGSPYGANGGLYPEFFASAGSRAVTAGRLGLGMQYQVSSSVGLRFDVERYRAFNGSGLGDLGADHLSLGVMLKF
jgi:OOP family OmpA-OmpF porin